MIGPAQGQKDQSERQQGQHQNQRQKAHDQARRDYAAAPADAAAALALGTDTPVTADQIDLAAWTMVANVLLNLDETVTKG